MNLNTGHALYGNLKMLIGVDESNALVDLVTPGRTFTPHASAVFGSGTLGRHFGVRRSGYTTYGASMSSFQPANNTGTLVMVVNRVGYIDPQATYAYGGFINSGNISSSTRTLPQIARKSAAGAVATGYNGSGGMTISAEGATSLISTSARMWSVSRNGTGAYSLALNGTEEVGSTGLGVNSTTGAYAYIGGATGQAAIDADIVWLAWFDVVLTPTQLSDLYASLGANNAISLVDTETASAAFAASATATFSGSASVTAVATFGVSATATFLGSVTVASAGTITTPPLKNNAGTLLANETSVTVNVYDVSTGALVLQKAGQTSNASGIVTVFDAALVIGTTYAYEVVLSANGRRLPVAAAT